MVFQILVVTPHPAFGELIQQSLEEVGRYRIDVALSRAEASARCLTTPYDLAILDSDIRDASLPVLARTVLDQLPNLRLVVIPPDQPAQCPELDSFPIQAFLNKPFYLPDLIETIEKLLPSTADATVSAPLRTASAPRLQPEEDAAGLPAWLQDAHVTEQRLADLAKDSGAWAVLIARAGEVWAYTSDPPQNSPQDMLAHLVRSWDPHSGKDLARFIRMAPGGRQAMLYATHLVEELVLAVAYDSATPFSQIRNQAQRLRRSLLAETPVVQPPTANPPPETPAETPVAAPSSVDTDWEVEPLTIDLPPLFDDIPSPAPQIEKDIPSAEQEEPIQEPLTPVSPQEWVAEMQLYTFLLVPRAPEHTLTEEMAESLRVHLPRICQEFHWKLEELVIRPDSLQWNMLLTPNGPSPDSAARIIRLQTSRALFETFPALKNASAASSSFWAPGCLILRGQQTISPTLVREFTSQARNRNPHASHTLPD